MANPKEQAPQKQTPAAPQAALGDLLTLVRKIKDLLAADGPSTLTAITDAVHKIGDFLSKITATVSGGGGTSGVPSFAQGSPHHDELNKLKAEVDAELAKVQAQAKAPAQPAPAGAQAGLLDWVNKVDPDWKSHLLSLLSGVLGKLLAGGVAI